jgi:hypothetical protein
MLGGWIILETRKRGLSDVSPMKLEIVSVILSLKIIALNLRKM